MTDVTVVTSLTTDGRQPASQAASRCRCRCRNVSPACPAPLQRIQSPNRFIASGDLSHPKSIRHQSVRHHRPHAVNYYYYGVGSHSRHSRIHSHFPFLAGHLSRPRDPLSGFSEASELWCPNNVSHFCEVQLNARISLLYQAYY